MIKELFQIQNGEVFTGIMEMLEEDEEMQADRLRIDSRLQKKKYISKVFLIVAVKEFFRFKRRVVNGQFLPTCCSLHV